jgi:uncharacterized protein (TIGR02594 family)
MNLLLSRRALGCAIATIFVERVFAVPAGVGELPAKPMLPGQPLPPSWGSASVLSEGVGNPLEKDFAIANRVLEKAPRAANPYEVAQYFDRVGRGLENPPHEDWKLYVREWPERYNPVILHFFDATALRKPEGDCTAWCSAFVNWCIQRGRTGRDDAANLTPTKRSAASMSFRDWGRQTREPKPGDIAVFQSRNSPSHGHVGFFSSQTDDYVTVLGGNQGGLGGLDSNESTCSDPRSVGGRVMEQKLRKKGGSLVLHSFRTDPSLHDIGNPTASDKPNQQASTNPVQTPDKPNQQASTNPVQTPDKPNQQASTNLVQTPDKPNQQASTNPVQTPDKPNQQASINPVQTPDKPNQQASTNPVQTPDRPNRQTSSATSAASAASAKSTIEIELPNGRKLRVNANIDSDILARLLAALDK